MVVALEDVLGMEDQPNIPGTIDEHPNWRRKYPVDLESLAAGNVLDAVARVAGQHGRAGEADARVEQQMA